LRLSYGGAGVRVQLILNVAFDESGQGITEKRVVRNTPPAVIVPEQERMDSDTAVVTHRPYGDLDPELGRCDRKDFRSEHGDSHTLLRERPGDVPLADRAPNPPVVEDNSWRDIADLYRAP
jgi:hypothetical protein